MASHPSELCGISSRGCTSALAADKANPMTRSPSRHVPGDLGNSGLATALMRKWGATGPYVEMPLAPAVQTEGNEEMWNTSSSSLVTEPAAPSSSRTVPSLQPIQGSAVAQSLALSGSKAVSGEKKPWTEPSQSDAADSSVRKLMLKFAVPSAAKKSSGLGGRCDNEDAPTPIRQASAREVTSKALVAEARGKSFKPQLMQSSDPMNMFRATIGETSGEGNPASAIAKGTDPEDNNWHCNNARQSTYCIPDNQGDCQAAEQGQINILAMYYAE